jgi:hypothetical protein
MDDQPQYLFGLGLELFGLGLWGHGFSLFEIHRRTMGS